MNCPLPPPGAGPRDGHPPRAYSILASGQSRKEGSPHFSDQARLFANNDMKPVAFPEEAIREGTIREYRPGLEGDARASDGGPAGPEAPRR